MDHPASNITEEHLWLAFREGSENAFDMMYGKMFPILFNYGYRLCQDEEQVKDCIQNIFVEIWQKREQVKKVYSLKYYFLKILRRKIFRELKGKRNCYIKLFSSGFIAEEEDNVISFLQSQQGFEHEIPSVMIRRIRCAIENLSSRKKEVIHLKFYENLTNTEISEVMELKDPKYVRQLIYRSLDELKKNLTITDDMSIPAYPVYAMLIMFFMA